MRPLAIITLVLAFIVVGQFGILLGSGKLASLVGSDLDLSAALGLAPPTPTATPPPTETPTPQPTATPTRTPTPTPIPRVACDVARDKVYQRHTTTFGLMRKMLAPVDFTCLDGAEAGSTAVTVHWYWNQKERRATYLVRRTLEVLAIDNNAKLIDDIAAAGVLGIRRLFF